MTFRSPFPDVEVPNTTIYDYLFGDIAEPTLDRPAIIDGTTDDILTYRQLISEINLLAGALASRGVAPGTIVGLLAPNSPAFATIFHAILRAGGTATTINVLYTGPEIAHQLIDAGATFLITIDALIAPALDAASTAGIDDKHLIVLDGTDHHPSRRDLLSHNAGAPEVSVDPAEHPAVLPYSSGTTGRPKGVVLTHRNIVANVAQTSPIIGNDTDDRILAVLPFFHIYGMTMLLNSALRQRASLVTMPRFDLTQFLSLIERHRCTVVYIAPPVATALAKNPLVDHYDLSSVHTVFSGAAPLDAHLSRAVATRLGCRVRQGYGMSEMSPVSHVIPLNRDDIPPNSVGLTLPNMECKLLDPDTGREIPIPEDGSSRPGELCCKGPNIMAGYLNNPEATAETVDSEGFLHTGDIATVDSNGIVTIVDRLKELIKYKGYQVAPAELEAILLTHPSIADAAVVGVTDDHGEEVPKAFVVPTAQAQLHATDIIDYVSGKVAPHKKIRQVQFIEGIPKSSTGKILRRNLRALI